MCALTALSLHAQKKDLFAKPDMESQTCLSYAVARKGGMKSNTSHQQLKTIYNAEVVAFSTVLQNSEKACFESTVAPGWTVTLLESSQRKLVYRIKHGNTLVYSFKVTEAVTQNVNSTLSDYERTALYNCYEQCTKKNIQLYTWERNGLKGISFKVGTRICHFTFASKDNAEEFRNALKQHFDT